MKSFTEIVNEAFEDVSTYINNLEQDTPSECYEINRRLMNIILSKVKNNLLLTHI